MIENLFLCFHKTFQIAIYSGCIFLLLHGSKGTTIFVMISVIVLYFVNGPWPFQIKYIKMSD